MALQQLCNGLATGFVYGLIALGYTLVFGVLRLVNFAHCDVMMVGAYLGYLANVWLGWGLLPSVFVAVGGCVLLGLLLNRVVYRPLRGVTGMPVFAAAIGAGLILEYTMMALFSAQPRAYQGNFIGGTLEIAGMVVPKAKLIALVLSLAAMIALQVFLTRSKGGRAMRACASDRFASQLCGINEDHAADLAFILGSALAGIAGVLYGSMFYIQPLMGSMPGLKAFCAAVIGGIGSIPGAVLGGIVLALSETFATACMNTAFRDAMSFILLVLVLLLRPRGILGRKERV